MIDGTGEVEIDLPAATLREVVYMLAERYGEVMRDGLFDTEIGPIRPENTVLLKGRHYRALPHGLESEVCGGDSIAIFPPMAGG
jgi:molybdopterin converting factor small subunit